ALFTLALRRPPVPPLALAVGFSMIASYLISSTLVPVMATRLFRSRSPAEHAHEGGLFERLATGYGRWIAQIVRFRWIVFPVYLLLCMLAYFPLRDIGTELSPRVDTGQFQLRVRAPAGMRLERTVDIVRGVDQAIRDEVGPDHVRMTLANIGNPAWTYPVNAVYVFNSGPQDAVLL